MIHRFPHTVSKLLAHVLVIINSEVNSMYLKFFSDYVHIIFQ